MAPAMSPCEYVIKWLLWGHESHCISLTSSINFSLCPKQWSLIEYCSHSICRLYLISMPFSTFVLLSPTPWIACPIIPWPISVRNMIPPLPQVHALMMTYIGDVSSALHRVKRSSKVAPWLSCGSSCVRTWQEANCVHTISIFQPMQHHEHIDSPLGLLNVISRILAALNVSARQDTSSGCLYGVERIYFDMFTHNYRLEIPVLFSSMPISSVTSTYSRVTSLRSSVHLTLRMQPWTRAACKWQGNGPRSRQLWKRDLQGYFRICYIAESFYPEA